MFYKLQKIFSLDKIQLLTASILYAVFFYIAFYYELLIFIYPSIAILFYIIFKNISLKKKLLYSWLASFLSILFSMEFVANTIIEFSRIGKVWAYLLLLLFSLLSTVSLVGFVALSHLLIKKTKQTTLSLIFIMPIGIIITEFLDWKIFPWQFGAIFAYNLYLSQLANIIGTLGLSYIIFLYGLLLYYSFRELFRKKYKRFLSFFSILLALNMMQFLYGYYFVKTHSKLLSFKKITALIVQANIANSAKLSIEQKMKLSKYLKSKTSNRQNLVLDTYTKITKDNINDIDLVFWPETAFPSRYTNGLYYAKKMDDFIDNIDKTVIFGSYYGRFSQIFNSIISKSPKQPYKVYNKQILMPFGEYMPLGNFFPHLYNWFPDVSHFSRGKIDLEFNYKEFTFLPIICYEALFPIFVSNKVKKYVPDVILHITNDSWFSNDGAKYHLLLSRMRATENNRPMLRVANTGYSAYIDAFGSVRQKTKFNTIEVLKVKLDKVKRDLTIYTSYGIYILALLIFTYLFYIVILFRRKNV